MIESTSDEASRLREERERLGIALGDLADTCQVSRSTQTKYELGLTRPDTGYLKSLEGLGFDSLYILTGTRKQACAAEFLDWELVARIWHHAEVLAREENVDLTLDKKIKLLKVSYSELVDRPNRATRALQFLKGIFGFAA